MSDDLVALLRDTADYLRDPRNHTWPYVESGQQMQDMMDIAARIDAAIDAAIGAENNG